MGLDNAEIADRFALRALIDEYAFSVDSRDADRFAALFVPAGTLAVIEPDETEPSLLYTGSEELRSVIDLLAPFSSTFHVMANHVVQLEGDAASGRTYCLAHHLTEANGEQPRDTLMLIRYDDSFRRAGDRWAFLRRDVLRQWTDFLPAEKARLAS